MRVRRAIQHRRNVMLEWRIVPKSQLVIANSNRTRADLIEHLPIASDRVKTIYYGIDAEHLRPGPRQEREAKRRELGIGFDQPVVAFIGALGDRRKGFDLVFDAWKLLRERQSWDAALLVIGQGAEMELWKSRAAEACLNRSIRFLGFRSDVPELLRACDALIAPARYEAYGLGVHEAICCGVPGIVSASAGVAERYTAALRSLLLSEPPTAERIADRLNYWRMNLEQLAIDVAEFSDALRARSWTEMAGEIVRSIDGSSVCDGELDPCASSSS
jgi:glycosyltransferase involved in cell wall biosynthesis